jgi:hypothetical protein
MHALWRQCAALRAHLRDGLEQAEQAVEPVGMAAGGGQLAGDDGYQRVLVLCGHVVHNHTSAHALQHACLKHRWPHDKVSTAVDDDAVARTLVHAKQLHHARHHVLVVDHMPCIRHHLCAERIVSHIRRASGLSRPCTRCAAEAGVRPDMHAAEGRASENSRANV